MGRLKDLVACLPFAALSPMELAVLASVCETRTLEGGSNLFEEGASDATLYLITAGTVDLFSKHLGKTEAVLHLQRGDLLSEMGLFGPTTHLTTATVASQKATCLCITADAFRALTRSHADLAFKILSALGEQLAQKASLVAQAQT